MTTGAVTITSGNHASRLPRAEAVPGHSLKDQKPELVTVYVTTDSEDTAVHMATTLVRERLVACVNIQSGTRSIYEYEGLIQLENEVTLIMKTTAKRAPDVVERARDLHVYEVPCITVLPILGGNQPYLDWVNEQVSVDAPFYEDEEA